MHPFVFWSIVTVTALLLIFVLVFFVFILPYYETVGYIKTEIRRTTGRKQEHWKRELKKLYASCVPLIGKYLVKHIK